MNMNIGRRRTVKNARDYDRMTETSEILPFSTVFFQPVELVTTCTLTMLGALEVVRAAYCAL